MGARARRLGRSLLPLVLRRASEYLLERARPARRARTWRPACVDLRLAGHRHGRRLQLPGAARCCGALRGRPRGTRGGDGRPCDRLHANGPGGRDRDARVRTARRCALGRVRRLRLARAREPDRRCEAEGGRLGFVRDRARPDRRLQAAARRRHRPGPVEAGALRDPAAAAAARVARARAGPRLGRGAQPRGAHRLCDRLGDGPALHSLHVGHDRTAEGDRPRQRRSRGGARLVDAARLRRRARRGLLGSIGRGLGRRSLVHRLRAAPAWLHDGALRRKARRHARCGRLLAGHLPAPRADDVHGADSVPRNPPAGSRGQPHRPLRPESLRTALPRRRALRP